MMGMGDTVSQGSGCSHCGGGGGGGRAAPPMRAELGGVVVLGGGGQAAKLATVSGFLFTLAQVEGRIGTYVPILFQFFQPPKWSSGRARRMGASTFSLLWLLPELHIFLFV